MATKFNRVVNKPKTVKFGNLMLLDAFKTAGGRVGIKVSSTSSLDINIQNNRAGCAEIPQDAEVFPLNSTFTIEE